MDASLFELYIAVKYNLFIIVVINIASIAVCRLINFAVTKITWRFKIPFSKEFNLFLEFTTNLIFTFELHMVTICCFYYYSTSTGKLFLVTTLSLATYYYLVWSRYYCSSQFLASHFVNFKKDLFDCHTNLLADYLFIFVQVVCLYFMITPFSKYLLEQFFLSSCCQHELDCWVCHHRNENIYLAAFIEFLGAFLIAGVISRLNGLSLVTLTWMFRLLVYPLLSIFGYDLIFIHILPVTTISYLAFCWNRMDLYNYFLVHWLCPFLGSSLGWLFFHPQTSHFKASKQHTKQDNLGGLIVTSSSIKPLAQNIETAPLKRTPLTQPKPQYNKPLNTSPITNIYDFTPLSSQNNYMCTNCDYTQDCTCNFSLDSSSDTHPIHPINNNNSDQPSSSSSKVNGDAPPTKPTQTTSSRHKSKFKQTCKQTTKYKHGGRTQVSSKSRFYSNLKKRTK